jgi:hypothetical protein
MHIFKNVEILKRFQIFFFSICLLIIPVIVPAQDETEIAKDIITALTMQGINCDDVIELDESSDDSDDGYDVVCEDGGHYSISKTANGLLSVVDSVTGLMLKGVGRIFSVIPFTGQIFQVKGDVTKHDYEVARSLFSIIELSGNECDGITSVVKNSADENIVSCENGRRYRIYYDEDGLVAVDKIAKE